MLLVVPDYVTERCRGSGTKAAMVLGANDLVRRTSETPAIVTRYIDKPHVVVGVICCAVAVPGLDPCSADSCVLGALQAIDDGGACQPSSLMIGVSGDWFNNRKRGMVMHGDTRGGHELIVLVVDDDIEIRVITRCHALECAIFGTAVKVASKGAVE